MCSTQSSNSTRYVPRKDPERERDRNPVRGRDRQTQHLSLAPWEKEKQAYQSKRLGLRNRDQVTQTREQGQGRGGNCVPWYCNLGFQMDPYLVPLLLCFKVSIHLLALSCVHISKTLALGQKPWEVDMGKESGLTVQAGPLALWRRGE